MEVVSHKFEQDPGIFEEAQNQGHLQPNLFQCTEADGYSPYCAIKFKERPEIAKQAQGQSLDLDYISKNSVRESSASAVSTISSLGLVETPIRNDVRFPFWLYFYLAFM